MLGKATGGLYSSYIDLYLFDNGRSQKEVDTKNTLQDVGCFSKTNHKKFEQRNT